MGGSIYFMAGSGELVRLDEQAWEKEVDFQDLLASHPDLLGADQIDATDPPRWLHIKGETAVPDSDDMKSRWSVDHLFVDQSGIPTLVEVKRSSDTRLRREVVGQILDYAANSVAYWSIEYVRSTLESRCEVMGLDPDEETRAIIGDDVDTDEFWMTVKTNLQAGRVRMLIVADKIPPELHRVVEFLNEQMDPAQILAVEVKRFIHGDQAVLVPTVKGQTAEAAARKTVRRSSRRWDEASVFEELEHRVGTSDIARARAMFDWIQRSGIVVTYGTGSEAGSFSARVRVGDHLHGLFHVYTDGRVEIPLGPLKAPFDTENRRLEIVDRLRDVGIAIPRSRANAYPRVSLDSFDEDQLSGWLDVWAWVVSEIRAEPDG